MLKNLFRGCRSTLCVVDPQQSPGDQVNDGREEEIARVPGCSSSECWSKSGILIHRDPVLMLLPVSMGMDHLYNDYSSPATVTFINRRELSTNLLVTWQLQLPD